MIDALTAYGGAALLAATLVLGVGALAVALTRRWDARQLTAELAVATALLAGLQVFAPLSVAPRESTPTVHVLESGAAVEPARAPHVNPTPKHPTRETAALVVTPSSGSMERRAARGPLAPWLFLAGAVLVGLHRLLGWGFVRSIHRRSSPAPAAIRDTVDDLAGRRVDSRVAHPLRTAFCYGALRPRMVLPLPLVREGSGTALHAVLQHEATHLLRRDPLRKTLVAVAAPFLFWNPVYWWLAREATECAEFIADEGARRALGRDRYARSLLTLAAPLHVLSPALAPVGPSFLRRRGELKRRLTMLHLSTPLQSTRTSLLGRAGRTLVASAALAALTLGLGRAAQDPGVDPGAQAKPYDIKLETRSAAALGTIVAHFAQASDGVSVKVSPATDADGTYHRVLLNGASLTSLRELEAFAREAGVMLVAAKPHSQPATLATDPLLAPPTTTQPAAGTLGALTADPIVAAEVSRTIEALESLLSRNQDGGLVGQLAGEPDLTRESAAISTFAESLFAGFGNTPSASESGPTITLEAQDISIGELISTIATESGANFVLGPEVQGKLTVRFTDTPWREALDASVHALGYRVVEEGRSVLRITRNVPDVFRSSR